MSIKLKKSNISLRSILDRTLFGSSYVVLLLVLCIIASILSPTFFTLSNLLNLIAQTVPFFIIGAGQTLVIILTGVDLSMGPVGTIGALVAGSMLIKGDSILLSILTALAIGAGFGLLNGLIITKVKINAFIATFGVSFIATGMLSWYFVKRLIFGFPESFRFLCVGRIGKFPFVIIIGVLVFLILYLLSHYTKLGRSIYSVGSNPIASEISGINTDKVVIIVYIISGLCAALSVLLFMGRVNTSTSAAAENLRGISIAVALLGGASFSGGIGSIEGAAIGAFIITLLSNIVNLIGISLLWQTLITGVAIILVMLSNKMLAKRGGVINY
ncbi:ribose ABC transporter permease [Candidatus Atribacteria bacterium HGW-Atribacteria-1]|nr:MAG: ribose ABC transporter permease [Candidatus Atribacteria bacterium HGW-Atribacteria-1]